MSQSKHIKKIASLVLVLFTVLLLVSCTKSLKVPYGDITDSTYLSLGDDITVTEKELYDAYRKQGATTLAAMFDEILFESEIALVEKLLGNESVTADDEAVFTRDELREEFNTLALEAIIGTSDIETIESLGEFRIQISVEKYVDSLFILDNKVNRTTLFTNLLDHINDAINSENETEFALYEFEELYESFKLRLAQKLNAKKQLALDVLDEEKTEFIKDSDLVTYYKNNVRNRHDVEIFIFSFRHAAEATAALRQLGIKADASGNWYKIPDIRTITQEDLELDYEHIVKILENLSITVGDSYEDRDYIRYYDAYTPNANRAPGAGQPDTKLEVNEIKQLFVDAYNLVNQNRPIELQADGSIVYEGTTDEFKTLYTYEELTKVGSSIRSYVYDSLTTEGSDEGKAYSSLRSSGNLRYLIFKIDEFKEDDLIAEEQDEDGNDVFIDEADQSAEQKALIEEMRSDLIDSKLTQSYITKVVNALVEESQVDIYDHILRSFYEDSYAYDGTTKNQDGNLVAKINDTEITVRQLFDRMDKSFGVNLALDLAINKHLLASKDDVINADDMKEFESDFRDLVNAFSRDEFAQAGYPASVGRAKFLLAIFGAETNQEAIELGFVIPELRNTFSTDYISHYGDNVYEKLAELTNLQRDKYKGVTVSHLLVYFDENGDGTPDNPKEYLDSLSETRRAEVLDGIVELITGTDGIYENLASDVDFSNIKGGLQLLASEVNNSGRIPLNNNTRATWTKAAELGLNLKFEDLGSEISNSTNFLVESGSTLDPVFYDRAIALHDRLVNQFEDGTSGIEYLDFYPYNSITLEGNTNEDGTVEDVVVEDLDGEFLVDTLMSDFGFHFILVTGINAKADFDYNGDRDINENYTFELDDKEYNAYNDDATISASQIEYYIIGNQQETGAALPSSLSTAFNKHFMPVFNRFNQNSYMQRELYFREVAKLGVTLANSSQEGLFDEIRNINKRQFFDYLNEVNEDLLFDQNYEDLYGQWFDILEA